MSKLMIYLADIPGTIKWPSPIRYTLQDLFDKVVAASSDFSSVKVEYSSQPPTLSQYDLLVYFVASRGDSVVKKGLIGNYSLGDTGTTVVGGQLVGSEVYLSGQQEDPEGLGKLAFHELMHNVCLMKNELHNVSGVSLGLEEVNSGTALSTADINLMVKNLTKKRVQWKDGYNYKPKKSQPGDPLADLL